ncbi:MAG TPA: hypothetical protein VFY84_16885 [Jiangellales bacterium]|nr:hypothetical protein [Jiangellales bacterium]
MAAPDLAAVTQLRLIDGGPPTALRLTGDVGPVLESTCVWDPHETGDRSGAVRAVDLLEDRHRYGLGAAAFGAPPERAVHQLGEYVLVDSRSWWTPAARPASSRQEPRDAVVLTPFLIEWDRMTTATARLDSPTTVPLVHWYDHLVRRLIELGRCRTGIVVVEILAETEARLVTDKHLAVAPLRENRPADRRLITDDPHLDRHFVRNGAAAAFGDARCAVVMVGVVAHPALALAIYGPELVGRAFYATPGISASAGVVQHTHAVVAVLGPAVRWPVNVADEFGDPTGDLDPAGVLVTHIENDTRLFRAAARIGVVDTIEMT